MNKTDWNGMFPNVPESFHAAVLHALDTQGSLPKSERSHPMKRKAKTSLLLAAALLICSIGAVAAMVSHWSQEAARRFEAAPLQQEALSSAGAAALPQQTAEANGLTITAHQTLGDRNGVYILFGVQPPAGIALSDDSSFDAIAVTLDGDSSLNWSGGFTPADNGSGQWYFELWLSNVLQEDWSEKTLAVTFTDLLQSVGKLEFSTALEGVWSFSWPLTYTNQSQTLAAGWSGSVGGKDVVVDAVELSPLSMTITLRGGGMASLMSNADLQQLGTLFTSALEQADGTRFTAFGGPGSESWTDESYTCTYLFDKVLDTEEAVSLTLTFPNESGENTLTIPLS